MVVEVMNVYVALDLLAKAVREAREKNGDFLNENWPAG